MKEKYNILDNNASYLLSNTDNYNIKLNVQLKELLDKFVAITIEYFQLMNENVYIKKIHYFKFILIRGLETIMNVFKMILFFTKT